jgi:hypothetical protein
METTDSLYRRVAIYIDNYGVEDLWRTGEPLTNVAMLIRGADDWALHNSWYDQQRLYEAASQIVIDPAIQLEIGCRLLQRAGVPEPPLCEHLYAVESFRRWQPQLVVHDEIGDGPPALDPEGVIYLAREAYSSGWFFYSTWATGGSNREWPVYAVTALARSLFALDGLRVCFEYVNDVRNLWLVCNWLDQWFKECDYRIKDVDGDLSSVVADVRERFARTRGRLEPMMIGRDKAQRVLERELKDFWEFIPQRVREDLITAEYKRSVLKDPTYDLWDVGHNYCLAVERIVNHRLGRQLEAYAQAEPNADEVVTFRKRYLNGGLFSPGRLTVHQWKKVLDPSPPPIFSKAGLDSSYIVDRLGKEMEAFIPFRVRAQHAFEDQSKSSEETADPSEESAEARLTVLRELVLGRDGIISNLSKMRIVLPE